MGPMPTEYLFLLFSFMSSPATYIILKVHLESDFKLQHHLNN